MAIQWRRGDFLTFYAKLDIRVGGGTEIKIFKGDAIEYDGTILKYAGHEVPAPSLRKSVEDAWFSDVYDDDSGVAPVQNNRNVASNKVKTTDLSRVHRMGANSIENSEYDEEVVMDVSERQVATKNQRVLTKNNTAKTSRGMNIESDSDDGGVVVGHVRTPNKIVSSDVNNFGNLANKIETAQIGRPIFNETHTGGIRMKHTGPMDRGGQVMSGDDGDDGVVVARVASKSNVKKHAGGIDVIDTSNIMEERYGRQVTNNGGPAVKKNTGQKQSSMIRDSIEKAKNIPNNPGNAVTKPVNGASKNKPVNEFANKIDESKLDPRVKIARRIYSDFPVSWDFTGKLNERLQRVNEFANKIDDDDKPDFIRALFAAEGDQMRRILMTNFADSL